MRTYLTLAAAAVAGVLSLASPASAELNGAMRLAALDMGSAAEVGVNAPTAGVIARVDLSDQKMYVYVGGSLTYTFPVSTGRSGYGTPTGRYSAEWLSPYHRSRKYNNAPMPWAVFFHGGYAVHGTTDIRRLGRPASHGCVRLHPDNAKLFFSLVKRTGMDSTLITIVR